MLKKSIKYRATPATRCNPPSAKTTSRTFRYSAAFTTFQADLARVLTYAACVVLEKMEEEIRSWFLGWRCYCCSAQGGESESVVEEVEMRHFLFSDFFWLGLMIATAGLVIY